MDDAADQVEDALDDVSEQANEILEGVGNLFNKD